MQRHSLPRILNNQKNIQRRNASKSERNINGMISIFRNIDPEELRVAKDLHGLPPVTFDHIDCTRLLKYILVLNNEISVIKEIYATEKQLIAGKNDVENLKKASIMNKFELNINHRKRGGGITNSFYLDNGPIAYLHSQRNNWRVGSCSTPNSNNVSAVECEQCNSANASKQQNECTQKDIASISSVCVQEPRDKGQEQSNPDVSVRSKLQTYASIVNETLDKGEKVEYEGVWVKVPTHTENEKRKKQNSKF